MTAAPCKDCVVREAGCHARCPAYISFKAVLEKENIEKRRMNGETLYFNKPRKEERRKVFGKWKKTRT